MNTIYRIIWNAATHTWVVASEFAKGRKKAGTHSASKASAGATTAMWKPGLVMLVVAACFAPAAVWANNLAIGGNGSIVATGDGSQACAPGYYLTCAGADGTGQNTAMGESAQAYGGYSTAVGDSAKASGLASTAFGTHATASGNSSTAFGMGAEASGGNSTAIGNHATASGGRSLSMGYQSIASAGNSMALGTASNASAENSVALGANSTTTADLTAPSYNPGSKTLSGTASAANGEISVGAAGKERRVTNVAAGSAATDAVNVSQLQSEAAKSDALIKDALQWDSTVNGGAGAYSANHLGNGASKITNVAAGDVSATSSDAVNGSQLHATNQQVEQNTTNIANNSTDITNIVNGKAGLVQQAAAGANLTVGKDTDGVAVSFADKDSNTRALKNVTAGVDDTDAVNVSQLKSSGLVDGNGNTLDAVTYDAGSNRGVVTFGGGANGTLLTNVRDGAIVAGSRDAVNGGQIASLRDSLQGQISHIDNRVTNIEVLGNLGPDIAPIGNPDLGLPYIDGNANGGSSNNANAGSTAGVAVGYNSNATGENSSVLGQNATALGNYGTAIGNDSYAAGPNDTALGGNAKVHADGSVAVGAHATVTSSSATNAVAVGADTKVSAASGTAIGQGATVAAAATGSVALGQGAVADRANTVSVGTAGGERQITNVAAGVQATDAVNVSQLTQGLSQANDWAKSYTDQQVNQVGNRASAGVASAMAMASLPQAYQPNQSSAGVALGNFRGEQSIAVGMSTISESGRYIFKANATTNTRGDMGVGVGAGMVW